MRKPYQIILPMLLVCFVPGVASAQSFRVQCPTSTITHPVAANNNSEPAYTGPTYSGTSGYPTAPANVNGAIKCQQISGGDGFATMADGSQTFMFSFGPLSGLADIAKGLPGTQVPAAFNTVYPGSLHPGDPDTTAWLRLSAVMGPRITAPLDLRTTYTPMRTATLCQVSSMGT